MTKGIMKDGKPVKITKEAYDRLVELGKTRLGNIPIGQVASNIIMEFSYKE